MQKMKTNDSTAPIMTKVDRSDAVCSFEGNGKAQPAHCRCRCRVARASRLVDGDMLMSWNWEDERIFIKGQSRLNVRKIGIERDSVAVEK